MLVRYPNLFVLAVLLGGYLLVWGTVLLLARRRRREIAKGFVVTSAMVVLTLGFLELLVALHLADFRVLFGTPAAQPWSHPGNLVDPTLLHLHRPHDDFVWEGVRYRYDRNGFRNAADVSGADVVVIGDSFIEGWGVTADELVTSRLAADLGQARVVNLGQSWYGPQQELEVLRRYALPLHPRTCVWSFFEGNDLQDVERYTAASKVWPELSRRNHSFFLRSFTKNALHRLRRVLEAGLGEDATGTLGYPSGVFRQRGGADVRMFFEYKAHRLTPAEERALGEVRRVVGEAGRLCRARGAELLVVFVPTKDRVYKRLCRFKPEAEPLRWKSNDLPRRIAAVAEEAGASFLDLTPGFAERAVRGEVLYFPRDSHWSPAGHKVAAAAIARAVRGKAEPGFRHQVARRNPATPHRNPRVGG
ncbi:MAG TPA: GDSL-type esterase/lipase family protein [Thermoanaerobaculia bacterium]|nr:GDSL-type esterase/lipase family protein [Thermoanaerobaculia bacterium]